MQKKTVYILLVSILLITASCSKRDYSRSNKENQTTESSAPEGENTLSPEEYNRLSQYVKAYYVKAYIDIKKRQNNINQNDNNALLKNSIEDPVSEADLKEILQRIPKEIKGSDEDLQQKTSDFFKSLKHNYNETWNKQTFVDSLTYLPKKYYEDWKSDNSEPRFKEKKNSLIKKLTEYLGKDKLPQSNDSANIKLNKQKLSLKVGDKNRLTANSENIDWKSEDPTVVKVDSNGVVEALSVGETTIYATLKGTVISDSCEITVKKERAFWGIIINLFLLLILIWLLYAFRKKIPYIDQFFIAGKKFFLKNFSYLGSKIRNLSSTFRGRDNNDIEDDIDEDEENFIDKKEDSDKDTEIKQLRSLVTKYGEENGRFRIRNKNLEEKISELEKKNKELEEKISELENRSFIINERTGQSSISIKKERPEENLNILYADAIIDGAFHRISRFPNEDSVFELHKIFQQKAEFTIYKEAYKRVLKNPDFVDGCEKQIIEQPAQNLEIEEGESAQNDSGKWVITRKAKIRFI